MTLTSGLQVLAGLAVLVAGAEALVRGSGGLARRLGIPPLIIGLTVVAFGTSSPEVSVSVMSSIRGQADLALGNVIGSNVFNVLFILGLSALITPLVVARQLVRLDVPLMLAASLLVVGLAWNGSIGRLEGCGLLAGLAGYVVLLIRLARRGGAPDPPATRSAATSAASADSSSAAGSETPPARREPALALLILMAVAGLGLLVLGSQLLIEGATAIARGLGLSELIIGLTIVAAGTSLPEVASSVAAALKRESDLAVGNVVGSNIFNLLGVLGAAALPPAAGLPVAPGVRAFDLPVMVAVAAACLPIFFTGHRISRWEGALFLAYYAAYTLYLVLDATGHDALPLYNTIMLFFALPLTAITLLLVAYRTRRGLHPVAVEKR